MSSGNKQLILGGLIVLTMLGGEILLAKSYRNKSIPAPVQELEKAEVKTTEKLPTELPFGGTKVLPNYRFVALYGNPTYPGLGSLGEQTIKESSSRIKKISKSYQQYSKEKIIPTFELITTVASAGPTKNNDYSQEIDIQKIKQWVKFAKEQGIYVVLDLQPGRSTFLSQAKLYESVLKEPHVGLALDPEWRLQKKSDRHLVSIGSVDASEINQTADWLAQLVKDNKLPQKIFMIHQFKNSMISNRSKLKTNQKELGWIIHMDGHGTQGQKLDTWRTIRREAPKNIFWGWKNFYDEDKPMMSVKQTMKNTPMPYFVSYQ